MAQDDRPPLGSGPDGDGAQIEIDLAPDGAAAPVADDRVELREESFESFCQREHASLARALALALDDTELGRDAAAEGLTRAWQRWSTVSALDNPAGWVYRVGLNWGRSRLRRRRREVTTALVPEQASGAVDYDDGLVRALARLTDEHRSVVVARYYLDWSEAGIAAALDIPAGTVKSRLHRALAHLDDDLRNQR